MKLRYIIDIDIDEEDTEMELKLVDDIRNFVRDHEYGCIANGVDVKLQDEYCIQKEQDLIKRKNAEIEQWKEEANKYQNLWCESVDDIQTAKSEAYDEFAEKLSSYIYGELNNLIRLTSQELKNLVKKMKGELENDR